MGAALGLGLRLGEVVVSIGTSGTAYAVAAEPAADESGAVAGFADATGRFLPLVATINAARVLTVTARMLGTDAGGLSRLALAAPPGARRAWCCCPTWTASAAPNRPGANGVLRGLTSANTTQENLARAAVEAVLCSLADAIDNLRRLRHHRAAGDPHRRRGPFRGGAQDRAGDLRRAGGGALAGRVRGARRGPAGRLGPVRRCGAAHVAAGRHGCRVHR